MTKPVVVFGTGSLASLAYHYLTHDSDRTVAGFTLDRDHIKAPELHGLPVVPSDEVVTRFPPETYDMFVVVGYSHMNRFREEKCAEVRALGYELISYVSSRASTWPDLTIGDNCFIMEHNIIQPSARLGSNIIMWGGCHVGHDTVIEDNVFICAHTVVSGYVTVGQNTFIGVNATIRDDVTIGRECVIGAGATITKSTEDKSVYAGPRPELLRITSDRLPGL
jgi:sugar O-acyltransferase (sialic acid O-acetyltransferase NeuD family)